MATIKTCQMISDPFISPLWNWIKFSKYTGRAGNMDIWTWDVRELFNRYNCSFLNAVS